MDCLKPRWEPPKTDYDSVDKFLVDLGRMEDICEAPAAYPEYEKLKRFVCNGDVDAVADVPWNGVIAFAAYYLIFHKRDLETARKAIELLESHMLDDEEEVMLKMLQVAYKAAADPPCSNPELLKRYVEKVRSTPEPTERVGLLKTLVLMSLTGQINAEKLKDKIERAFKKHKTVVFKCKAPSEEAKKADCVKEVIYRPMPFHHFTFYVASKVRPLCPVRRTTFEECLDRRKSFRKIVSAALVPAATAVFVVLFHKLLLPFVLVSAFYVLWAIYQSKIAAPVCIHGVWNRAARMLEAGNLALLGAYIYAAIATVGELNPQFFISAALMTFVALSGFSIYAWLEPHKPHGVDFPRTGARGEHREYRRFFEDLADAWNMQDMCSNWLPYEHYNKLRTLICRGDFEATEKVSENWPLIFAAYYLLFHKRDLEAAQKVLDLVKSRRLDEKDKAALEILETARGAVENPPCSEPEALRRYVEKIDGVKACGWASVLKALVVVHLTDDEDYKDDVRLAILWTAENRHCDNTSICYFAYRMLNRIKPLCRYLV